MIYTRTRARGCMHIARALACQCLCGVYLLTLGSYCLPGHTELHAYIVVSLCQSLPACSAYMYEPDLRALNQTDQLHVTASLTTTQWPTGIRTKDPIIDAWIFG